MYNIEYWTNVPYMYELAELQGTDTMLWHEHRYKPIDYFKSLPAWNQAKKIYIVGQEAEFMDYVYSDPRVYVWDSVVKDDYPRYYHYFFWWHQALELELHLRHMDKIVNPLITTPSKHFEYVARYKRPHRIYTKNLIQDNNLQKYFLHNFYDDNWRIGSEIEQTNLHDIPTATIKYNNNQIANHCCILPYKIYNDSWFSIVSETSGDISFFTEKTAKMFMAKRLFVFFGAQGALKDLQNLGYKTFDNIIDESYDSIPDNIKRWEKAFEQVKYICTCDPEVLYKQAQPILDHNHRLFLSQDWLQNMTQQMNCCAYNKYMSL